MLNTINTIANNYKTTDSGRFGKAIETAIKEYFNRKNTSVSAAGKTDFIKAHMHYEIKISGGELGLLGGKLIKGSSLVLYVPVVNGNGTIKEQEGFFLTRDNFLKALEQANLIRTKKATNGTMKTTIQTFWNVKANKAHSAKAYARLLDALYENCETTLEEWLEA